MFVNENYSQGNGLAMSAFPPLARAIRRIRGGMTQQKFAAMLKVSQGTIAKYESGQATPRAGILLRIARAAGVTLEELMETSLEPRPGAPVCAPSPKSAGNVDIYPLFEAREIIEREIPDDVDFKNALVSILGEFARVALRQRSSARRVLLLRKLAGLLEEARKSGN